MEQLRVGEALSAERYSELVVKDQQGNSIRRLGAKLFRQISAHIVVIGPFVEIVLQTHPDSPVAQFSQSSYGDNGRTELGIGNEVKFGTRQGIAKGNGRKMLPFKIEVRATVILRRNQKPMDVPRAQGAGKPTGTHAKIDKTKFLQIVSEFVASLQGSIPVRAIGLFQLIRFGPNIDPSQSLLISKWSVSMAVDHQSRQDRIGPIADFFRYRQYAGPGLLGNSRMRAQGQRDRDVRDPGELRDILESFSAH